MGHRFVFLLSIYAFGMAFFFAESAYHLPSGNAAIPASMSFLAIAALSFVAANTLRDQEKRIATLERQLTAGRGAVE